MLTLVADNSQQFVITPGGAALCGAAFVVLVLLVWLVQTQRRWRAVRRIYELAGEVWFDFEERAPQSPWMMRIRELFGEQAFSHVNAAILGPLVTDADMRHLSLLTSLQDLDLSQGHVTDRGLRSLVRLRNLRELNLAGTQISDAGLAHLSGLPRLTTLNLRQTPITDAGTAVLTHYRRLVSLDLVDTQVTDAGLEQLAQLATLQRLRVGASHVTAEGVRKLQARMPRAEIAVEPSA